MNDTPFQRDELIEAIARRVVASGLEVPAVFLLELNKPVSFVTGQAGLFFVPILAPFFGIQRLNSAAEMFSERENVERLIQRIEELGESREAEGISAQAPATALLDPTLKGGE